MSNNLSSEMMTESDSEGIQLGEFDSAFLGKCIRKTSGFSGLQKMHYPYIRRTDCYVNLNSVKGTCPSLKSSKNR